MAAPNVKFPREIHQEMRGRDVIGHKRALSRARPDLYKWITSEEGGFTDLAGEFFMDAVVKWKISKGLGNMRVLGGRAHEVLERTHRKGSSVEWAFDQIAINHCQAYYDAVHQTPEDRIRDAICAAGFYWYARKFSIPYVQARPFPLLKPPSVPAALDCSEFVTICHWAGGSKDPNGRGFDGQGYTGTLMRSPNTSRVFGVASLKPGDLIFYGSSAAKPGFNAGDPTHVALYVGIRNGIHMILTMGSYPMKFTDYRYRHDIHSFYTCDVIA